MILNPRHSVAACRRFALIALVVPCLGVGVAHAQGNAPGGFLESATEAGLRPRPLSGEIRNYIPERGRFTFPEPYLTTGVRLTNDSDCAGADCVQYVGYSYWSNINNHTGSNVMLVFLGLERRKGGGGPTLFSYDKQSGETRNLGPLFSPDSPYSWNSGEGWYFSATKPTALYMNDGPRMLRYDVQNRAFETVYDVRDHLGADKYIWQVHSSHDDRVHSATVRHANTYEMLGCIAYREDTRKAHYYPKTGDYDECQIDKSGRWLVIKENVDGADGEDNRIIDLETGTETRFLDRDGAAGHSDLGYGYMVAEDNFYSAPGATRIWRLGEDHRAPGQGTLAYELSSWSSGVGHIAHGNSQAGMPITGQMACVSNASRQDLSRVNEIVCFRLDGSLNSLVVAPNLTDLNASGGGSEDYSKMPKGNLDVTGEYFIWTANAGSGRLDAYIVRIPYQKLGGGSASPDPAPTPAPAPAPAPAPSPEPAPTPAPSASAESVRWIALVNVTVSGNALEKTGGCDGCPDGSAVSEPQVQPGNGTLEFAASETGTLRLIGLDAGGVATGPADISFGVRLQGGTAEVRERGSYKAETSFATGDRFQITVENGTVTYRKNGAVFYASANRAGEALRVHALFYDRNATLREVLIRAGSSSTSSSAVTDSALGASPAVEGRAQRRPGANPITVPPSRRRRF